jgi:nucleotide-binding universal stress UspA family protein
LITKCPFSLQKAKKEDNVNEDRIKKLMELKMSKKILVAIDGSEISWNTARIAIQLAKVLNTEILGLHVIDEELVLNDYAEYQKELGKYEAPLSRTEKAELFESRGHEILELLKSWCQDSDIQATTEIGLGGVGETVLKQGGEAMILAIGRRGNGHPNISDYLGKNFRYTAHRTEVPLLVGGDSAKALNKILLAYNGSTRAKKALQWAKQLQQQGSFEILALVVQEDDDFSIRDFEKEVKTEFSQSGVKNFRLIMRKGIPSDEISITAMDSKSDIVLMGGYRHSAVLEWLEGSTLDSVLRKITLPVLVA